MGTESPFAGFFVDNESIGTPETRKLIREVLLKTGLDLKTAGWKLVGETAALSSAEKVLTELGFKTIEKKVRQGVLDVLFNPRSGRVRVATHPTVEKTRVLIVDDSKTIRSLLEKVLTSDSDIEVVGTAEKPSDARKILESLGAARLPHVITLDIHMPEMDGVAFLKSYLPKFPIPTIMISSISMEEGPLVLSALESGAVDYVQKPSFEQLKDVAPLILEKVKLARFAKIQLSKSPARTPSIKRTSQTARLENSIASLVAIGSSTGGTEALRQLFLDLPDEIPPMVVVQHIPAVFSKAFADRMNDICPFAVKEAEDGDDLCTNRVLVAPGGTQMKIVKSGSGFKVQVDPNAGPVNRHKPSVDFLFDSVAELFGAKAVGVLLTGMGSDGAKGLLKMKQAGSRTIGQDEASSVVYGMPRAAFELGAVDQQLPLLEIAGAVTDLLRLKRRAAS
ncbi:MAG: chemotaxis response regulator protein-glutamate methylesterase [Cryobacterium sp.]|nr:chemotaxis response regulator protein-glutamate methylesterase [Oligoflexia bacterium]